MSRASKRKKTASSKKSTGNRRSTKRNTPGKRVASRTKNKANTRKSASARSKKKDNYNILDVIYRHSWISEVLAIVFLVASVFVALSFISAQLVAGVDSINQNVMGPLGHVTATLLGGFFGWSLFLPLLCMLFAAVHFWGVASEEDGLYVEVKSLPLLAIGLILLTVSSAIVFAVFSGKAGGGDIGHTVAEPLVRITGKTGGTLISLSVWLLSLGCVLQKSTLDVITSLVSTLATAVQMTFVVLYNALVVSISCVFSCTSACFAWCLSKFTREYEEDDYEEEEKLPKPRLRKNKIEESQWEVNTEAAEVLVSRRKRERAASKKAIGTLEDRVKKAQKHTKNAPYIPPSLRLLSEIEQEHSSEDDEILRIKSQLIEEKLKDFGIRGRVTEVHPGPVITLFEFEPAAGVKVGKIAALQDDLAMSLKANSIRIIAPLPRKGTVGIEVPNKTRELVALREVLESESFISASSPLTVALGKDTYGDPIAVDIAKMPHLLVAGATGTGKSVCINAILLSLLYRSTPEELGLILIDPKILELSVYEGIPHLKVPVVTVPKQAKAVLEWAVKEMDKRYRLMQRYGVRSIKGYNQLVQGEKAAAESFEAENDTEGSDENIFAVEVEPISSFDEEMVPEDVQVPKERLEPLSQIVIVIDELADLMLSVGRDIEDLIARLAQKARAAGIHLIVATQRPSVDVITGLIKANFPARVSFRVSSRVDSRTILDSMGAEKLLGMGDMLYMLPGQIHVNRAHGAFVSDDEVKDVIDAIKKQSEPSYDPEIIEICERALQEEENEKSGTLDSSEYDSLYDQAVEFVLEKGAASTSLLQRAFRIGYNRAARIIDTMENEGIIGPVNGAKPREILVQGYQEEEVH